MNKLGKLFVVGGPIGNLEDITLRALRILKEVDLILCEDTRRTKILLTHYDIHTPLLSYNEYNESKRIPKIINDLQQGKVVAILSDAGTPGISDPGFRLVRELHKLKMEVITVPGPSAVTAALSIAGLPTDRFAFEGFLPKGGDKKRMLKLKAEKRTLVFFASVYRIKNTLKLMLEVLGPEREVVLLREMTKTFEEVIPGTLDDIINKIKTFKGEWVILVAKEGYHA